MGLKGYRLWAMDQLDSTCRAPPRGPLFCARTDSSLGVAVQVERVSKRSSQDITHFIGLRVEKSSCILRRYDSTGYNLYSPTLHALQHLQCGLQKPGLVGQPVLRRAPV
jgi:hypothetical protein